MPGIPKIKLHNPVLAYEVGEEFLNAFHSAAKGELEPFILVIEGSIPNEKIKEEGFWSGFGVNAETGQPITVCEWIDELAPIPATSSDDACFVDIGPSRPRTDYRPADKTWLRFGKKRIGHDVFSMPAHQRFDKPVARPGVRVRRSA